MEKNQLKIAGTTLTTYYNYNWDTPYRNYDRLYGLFKNKEFGIFDKAEDIMSHPHVIMGFGILIGYHDNGRHRYKEIIFINKDSSSYIFHLNDWTFFTINSDFRYIKYNGVNLMDISKTTLIIKDKYGEKKEFTLNCGEKFGSVFLDIYNAIMKYSKYESWYDYNNKSKVISASQNIIMEEDSDSEFFSYSTALSKMIGLESVKKDVTELISLMKVRKIREENNLPISPSTLHLVFTGNPGTGKTTVARLLGDIYKEIGILDKGHFIEADRASLVGEYIGHTAVKTTELFNKAIGGILFIDEAYSLNNESKNDFGKEAIECLLKLMEDNREKIVVIIAGYTDKINSFIESNPGLRSRFPKYIHFEDYNNEELLQICIGYFNSYKYILDTDAELKLREVLSVYGADDDFGNARGCRNIVEKIITTQAVRIADLSNVDIEELVIITEDDIINSFKI